MKLLLTSAGITTQVIADKLGELVGDGNKKVVCITTASNVEPGNKDWFLRQISGLQKNGYDWIDFVDPSAADVDWKSRLQDVGIVFVNGGNTFHLLHQARETGFAAWLHENIERIVYVGVSAGSIITTPSIGIAPVDNGDENLPDITDLTGLGFVDFEVSPHTPEMVSVAANKEYATTISRKLYAYNDRSALCVTDDGLAVLNDGEYWEFN